MTRPDRAPTDGRGDYAGPLFSRQQMRYWLDQQRKTDEQNAKRQRQLARDAARARRAQVAHLAKHNARGVTLRPLVAAIAKAYDVDVFFPRGCDVDYVMGVDRTVAWLV